MKIDLHTVSRDNLFEATATYKDGEVIVKKGSRINIKCGKGYKPLAIVKEKMGDRSIVDERGTVLKDISFSSLSTAASFVTGRTSNGMITWKTSDGKYVRETLKPKEK